MKGQEELSLRSDELSRLREGPRVGEGCSWICDLHGERGGEMAGWFLTVEVARG